MRAGRHNAEVTFVQPLIYHEKTTFKTSERAFLFNPIHPHAADITGTVCDRVHTTTKQDVT